MKTLPHFLGLLALLTFAGAPALRAQYNPPPPPDQLAPPADQDQAAPPPDDQQQAPPTEDQGAPPPDDDAAAGDASGDANFQTFYNDLSSQGTWVQTDNYGYAWQPNVQDPNWAPYTDGHWVYTDEGWAWVADDSEPWGWATYHYGRWVNIDGEGWVWVPGYTWAPAWVSWRYGGGYCGWAPLPPDTFVGIDFGGVGLGFHIGGDCDTAYGIGPGYYNFLPVGDLGSRDYHRYYRNRNDNFALVGNTRNVTSINVTNRRGSGRFGRVTTGGPSFATVNAQSHTPVQRVQLERSSRVGNSSLSGNRLAVYAPRVNAAAAGASYRPRSVDRKLGSVQVNRGTNIAQPLAVNSRLKPAAASAQQIQAANTAESHAPKSAGIATVHTRPTDVMTRSLDSYQPHHTATARTHTTARSTSTAASARTEKSTGSTDRADHAFTGQGAGNQMTETEARQAANKAAERKFTNAQAAPAHTSTHANAESERTTQREQAKHASAQREQTERAPEERAAPQHAPEQQRAPVQHEVQHAAPPHAAPPQHAAPQQAAPQPAAPAQGGGPPDQNNHH